MSQTHHYSDVDIDTMPEFRTIRLPTEAFHPSQQTQTMNLHKIAGANAKPTFYSPSATNWGQRDADLELVNKVVETNSWHKVDLAWQGAMVIGAHRLVIKQAGTEQWWFPRIHFPGSCVLAIPAKMGFLPNSQLRYFVVDLDGARTPSYLCMWDLREWDAVHYTWHSIAWQAAKAPATERELGPALRAFGDAEPDVLLKVLAKEAFFNISPTLLKKAGPIYQCDLSNKGGILDVVHSLVMQVLDITAEDALVVCRKRLANCELKEEWCEELMQLDEAQELLDRQDHTKVAQEQKAAAQAVLETKELKVEYAKRCREVASAKEAAAKGRGSRKKKAGVPAPPKVIVIPEWPSRDADLSRARACCPPGGTIWASQRFENWQAHYKPFSHVSRSWHKYGYAQSLNECLKYLWRKHSEVTNIPLCELGVQGLFEDLPATEVATPAAASSSRPSGA